MKSRCTFLLSSALLFGACVDVDTLSEPEAPVPDETEFYDTVVHIEPDGTARVSEPRLTTAGEQRAQNARRAAIERGEVAPSTNLVQDGGCAPTSWWLYSRTDWTGARLCISGAGTADLAAFYRYVNSGGRLIPIGTWDIASGSYWPGEHAGWIRAERAPYWLESWPRNGLRRAFDHASPAESLFLYPFWQYP